MCVVVTSRVRRRTLPTTVRLMKQAFFASYCSSAVDIARDVAYWFVALCECLSYIFVIKQLKSRCRYDSAFFSHGDTGDIYVVIKT